ncbi:Polyadenylate-binding protein 4-like protein [Aphelenchoides avenae]|nr:Polyadenylate-binding protein 4-like protein [Aphelenchus avenae]
MQTSKEIPLHFLNPRPGLLYVWFNGSQRAVLTDEELRTMFEQYGKIRQITLVRGMPAGLVEYEEREDAMKAMEDVDGRLLEDGVKMCAGWTKDSRCSEDVRVCRVPSDVTREQLKAEFNRYDDVRCAGLQYKPWTGERTGYAYVTFVTRERALKAKQYFRARIDKDGTPLISWQAGVVHRMPGSAPNVTVAFLPRDATEEAVRSRFEAFGEVLSVELKEHQKTGVFVAEVRFTQPEHAMHAIDAMDGAHFDDTVIRVSWSPKSRPRGFNLIIYLLPEGADRRTLKQRLECFGDIRRAEVIYNWNNGESVRCAVVAFTTREQANAAAKAFCSRHWQGAAHNGKWSVDWCDGHVLVVFNLGPGNTERLLREVFSNYGIVSYVTCSCFPLHNPRFSDIVLVHDQVGEFKGHAFVVYDNTDGAQRAIDAMDGAQLGGSSPTSLPEGFDVQVKNLPASVDHRTLHRHFQEFDGILRVEVMYDWTTGKHLGAGFIRFATRQQALAALESCGGLEDAHGAMILHLPADDELGSEDDSKPVTLTFKSTDDTDRSDDDDT